MLTTVVGIDRTFDYLVPPALEERVRPGTVVRINLGPRRLAGWVVADGVVPDPERPLRELRSVTGWGPEPELLDLAEWGAWRWAGRRAHLLTAASPVGAVRALPAPDLRRPAPPADPGELDALVTEALAGAGRTPGGHTSEERATVVRFPPAADPTALVALVAQHGPTLVVVPDTSQAATLAHRLRRAGGGVALLPEDWARARAGAAVVIGARGAAWAPAPGLAAVVVLDAHDESLVQEQAPTWWATAVVAERARRAGVPLLLVSACPTLDLLAAAPRVVTPSVTAERRGWAPVRVVDRRGDDPRLGLYSEQLVRALRDAGRAVCVLNRTGRARLLICGACGAVAPCERCGAAVVLGAAPGTGPAPASPAGESPARATATPANATATPAELTCLRCGTVRPAVCAVCDSTRLRQLRPGVSKVRTELEVLLARPVGELTAATVVAPEADVVVGTEAVLHRSGPADVVAFLDFDQELLAPRMRAGEEALALLARAARLVGGRRREGAVLVQTRTPDHDVLAAAVSADPSRLSRPEAGLRHELRLPPDTAMARLSGPGAAALVASIGAGIEAAPESEDRWLLRAASAALLCDALAAAPRPDERVRIEVDPVRA